MFIFCYGMMRSGSTLQYQLVSSLVERANRGHRLPWHEPEDFPKLAAQHADDDAWLVFKAHWCSDAIRGSFSSAGSIGFGIHRDLRDVMISHAEKYDKPLTPEHCRRFVQQCMDSFGGWNDLPRTMIVRYDELINETTSVIQAMAKHLGLPCSEATAQELADLHTPDAQRARIRRAADSGTLQDAWPGGPKMLSDELLHADHLADGHIGKWKERLTPECFSAIDDVAGGWLLEHGYEMCRAHV
ncbi:MAG: sulfotransferase domain-containing protein [Phycisphaerales bacterium]|nr:sulfotransferase domain-containing protein [Phycisphaerales bacterium]